MKLPLKATDASLNPNAISIKCLTDPEGIVHFRAHPLAAIAAARFESVQHAFIRGMICQLPETRIALSLILFDGIVTLPDLKLALLQVQALYIHRDHACIEWTDAIRRVNRRVLSTFTRWQLAQTTTERYTVSCVLSALDTQLADVVRGPKQMYSLELLLLDAQAWILRKMPGPLTGHALNVAPLAALGQSTLARQETQRALARPEILTRDEASESGFAAALGGFLNPLGADRGSNLIAEMLSICHRDRNVSNTKDKMRMLKGCLGLAARAAEAGPISSMILAWAIDLIESGTRTKQNVKAITPVLYIRAAARILLDAFRGKDLENFAVAEFAAIYAKMMVGLSPSRQRRLASALGSWHYFLSCWAEVESLRVSLHKGIPLSPPNANILWPHEADLIRSWLDKPCDDERFQEQLSVAFEIGYAIRIRASELLHLRISDIDFKEGGLDIHIATREKDGGGKTLAARRTESVSDPRSVKAIRRWFDRRKNEEALPTDYLFGDPYAPSRLFRAGELYLQLNQLLKAATGDPSMSTHSLSHTRISFDFLKEIGTPLVNIDINPFDQRSADAGHRSASTSFQHYFHLFEEWFRTELDKALLDQFTTIRSLGTYVGMSPSAFRQACSRQIRKVPSLSKQGVVAVILERTTPKLDLPRIEDGFEVVNPIPPRSGISRKVSLTDTLNLLHDTGELYTLAQTALRSGRTAEWVNAFSGFALELLASLQELDRDAIDRRPGEPFSGLMTALSCKIGERFQVRRVAQAKAAFLYEFLESSIGKDVANRGIDSWLKSYQKGYLSLDRPAKLAGFIGLLDAAEVPREFWRVRSSWSPTDQVTAGIKTLLGSNSQSVRFDLIQPRRGRPRAYLVVDSMHRDHHPSDQPLPLPSAAVGMSGINAMMLAAAIRRAVISSNAARPTNSASVSEPQEQT